jgi:predicted RNA-binding protein with PUA-like domain
MDHWLVKQEPEAYSFDDFLKDRKTDWTGVRNFQARNNLKAMKKGDHVLFYHSVSDKMVVGVAVVSKEAFPDPTDTDWVAVELKPVEKFARPVPLSEIKDDEILKETPLIKQSRLSVMSLTKKEYDKFIKLSKLKK